MSSDLGLVGYDGAREIGRGGSGTAYLCRQKAFDRDVVVKVITTGDISGATLRMFERECRAVGALHGHPNVITVFDAGTTLDGRPYISMEFAPGGSLAEHVKTHGPMAADEAAQIGAKVASALAVAHQFGILHRDVKPANVLLNAVGEPLLADFGIAKLSDNSQSATGTLSGTLVHMAPEVLDGAPHSVASDVYSLGSTLATILLGSPPFAREDDSTGQLIVRILRGELPDFVGCGIKPEMAALLERSLSRQPDNRPASAGEFEEALRKLSSGPSAAPPRQQLEQPGVLWPTPTMYAMAIQATVNPIRVANLADATLMRGAMGLPALATGQNAIVFEFGTTSGPAAVRCFTRAVTGAKMRYERLYTYLLQHACPPMTIAHWHDNAVLVAGTLWPVVVMPWVPGRPLDLAIEELLGKPDAVRALGQKWLDVLDAMQKAGVAHGDLQNGNVLVDDSGNIRLVDLDGVFAPPLRSALPDEIGHPNFQHPRRTVDDWAADVDGFSGLLIYASIAALAADPGLWRLHSAENLLLSAADLEHPGETAAWKSLTTSSDAIVGRLFEHIASLCLDAVAPRELRVREIVRRCGIDTDRTLDARMELPTRVNLARQTQPADLVDPPLENAWWTTGQKTLKTEPPAKPEADPPTRSGLFSRTGRNAITVGAASGLIAGTLGTVLEGVLRGALQPQVRAAVLVATVGALLGGMLSAWSLATLGAWRRATEQLVRGTLLGGLAALVALVPAEGLYLASVHRTGSPPLATIIGIWVLVSASVGIALGCLRRTLRTTLSGALGGVFGGVIGGAVAALSSARIVDTGSRRALDINGLKPGTLIAVAAATTLIGIAIGTADRVSRRAWLTVIEGTRKGKEVILDRTLSTIGSSQSCTLALLGDAQIEPTHARLQVRSGEVRVYPIVSMKLNGEEIEPVDTGILVNSGDVVQIGRSFIRLSYKERR